MYGRKLVTKSKLIRKSNRNKRFWIKKEIKPTKVQIIGLRILHNGFMEYEDDLKQFLSTEKVKVFLVSKIGDLKSKPFYIPFFSLKRGRNVKGI